MFLSKAVLMVNDSIMNSTENEDLKITLMKMMIDFLNYEEETANAIAALKSVKKSQEVDLGVFYGVTTKFVNDVIHGLDKVLSGTGVSVSNLIEERLEGKSEGIETWEKLARCAVALHVVWAVRQFIKVAYNVSELKAREFVPSKPGKDPKPAARVTAYANERLELIKVKANDQEAATSIVDIVSPFDDENLNIARCKTVFDQLSPEEFQDDNILVHNGNGDNTEIVDGGRKRSVYSQDIQDDSSKRARYS
ncbi:hypothetical protein D0Z03_000548 [Geotrichum reessii]|nr:hypothetical protein D0Z03_000548 [Galactomyces reessii]